MLDFLAEVLFVAVGDEMFAVVKEKVETDFGLDAVGEEEAATGEDFKHPHVEVSVEADVEVNLGVGVEGGGLGLGQLKGA